MDKTPASAENFRPADNPWIVYGGIASLFIYAAFWLMDIGISKTGGGLMVFFFLLAMFSKQRIYLLSEPLLYILIAWVLFQVGVYQWSAGTFPELREDHIREARVITYVFMFVVVAWWLGGNNKRIAAVISLCAFGYLIGATFQENGLIDEIKKFFDENQVDFLHKEANQDRFNLGYRNAQHTAVYSSFVFLSLLILQNRIISIAPKRFRLIARIFVYTGIFYSALAIIATQTRATWLGLIITAIVSGTAFLAYKFLRKKKLTLEASENRSRTRTIAGIAIVLAGVFVTASMFDAHTLLKKRLSAEKEVITKILEGNPEDVQISSVGIRIKMWHMALGWIEERPLSGWGPQSRKVLLKQSDLPTWVTNLIRHLHNSYIELLVAYGLVGLGLFAGLFVYVWVKAWQAWKYGYIPNDIMLFCSLWSVYWLVVNVFESYVIYSATGAYINAIVAGILLGYHLKRKQQKLTTQESSSFSRKIQT